MHSLKPSLPPSLPDEVYRLVHTFLDEDAVDQVVAYRLDPVGLHFSDVTLDPARAPIVLFPQHEHELSGPTVHRHFDPRGLVLHLIFVATTVFFYPVICRPFRNLQVRGYPVATPALVVSQYAPPSHLGYISTFPRGLTSTKLKCSSKKCN